MADRRAIKVKYIPEKEIHDRALDFLRVYNSANALPVPLEHIVEFDLGISLLAIPHLKKRTDKDGFISSDFKIIILDEQIFYGREERTRFTIAHEIGHLYLHKPLYESAGIKCVDDFIKFQNDIGEKEFHNLEVQANKFASVVLCPEHHLRETVESFLSKIGGVEHFTVSDLQNVMLEIKQKFCISLESCLIHMNKFYPELVRVAEETPF